MNDVEPHLPHLQPALERLYGHAPDRRTVVRLKGDASSRSYYRVTLDVPPQDGPASVVVMQLPPDPGASDEATDSRRAAAARAEGPELPFVQVQRLLRARGVPVPAIYDIDRDHGLLLLEDLGDESFESQVQAAPRERWPELYGQAVDLLAQLHARCAEPEPGCIAYERGFDEPLLRWELDHFRQWGLEALYGPLSAPARRELDRCFDVLARELASAPVGFVHRDFQSRNLMVTPARPDPLVVIDFQDALQGPVPYDLVALLCDSYIEIDAALQHTMIERYAQRRDFAGSARDDFSQWFWKVAMHRKLKDAGRFVYIDRVRGNPSFLRWFGPSLRYVGRALRELEGERGMARLWELLARGVPGFPDRAETPRPAAEDRPTD